MRDTFFGVLFAWRGHSALQHGETVLHLAAYKGNLECIRFLLDAGADKDAKSEVRSMIAHC